MQPIVPLVFHNLPSLYPPSFRRNDFYTCFTDFWLCQCTIYIIDLQVGSDTLFFGLGNLGLKIVGMSYEMSLCFGSTQP